MARTLPSHEVVLALIQVRRSAGNGRRRLERQHHEGMRRFITATVAHALERCARVARVQGGLCRTHLARPGRRQASGAGDNHFNTPIFSAASRIIAAVWADVGRDRAAAPFPEATNSRCLTPTCLRIHAATASARRLDSA